MPHQNDASPRDWRTSGLTIAAATVLAIAFVAHHPVPSVRTGVAILASIDQIRGVDQMVHGGLIGLMLALLAGFAGFADQLGARRPAVRAGLILYGTGCLAAIGAAVLDGFVVPDIARHFLAAPPDEQKAAYDLIVFAGFSVQDLTKLAFILMSGAILTWAVVLWRRGGAGRVAGLVGLLAGGAPIVLLVGSSMILRPSTLLAILGAQSVWNGCAAWRLIARDQGRAAA